MTLVINVSSSPGNARKMTVAIIAAAAFAILATILHVAGIAIAAHRCRPAGNALPAPPNPPSVSVMIPVCGLDNFIEDTLRTGFRLDYPHYELIFCVARADDVAIPLLRRLIANHPWIDARILIGDERISANPKLNNIFKGWRDAACRWIAMPDSNVLMPRDYIQRLFASIGPKTGLVCSPPIGCLPSGFWAELECAFLNNYQARWQYFADTIGMGFAQGKTMFWRRDDLEKAGGIRALGSEVAEDAASTKIVRRLGLHVRLMEPPVRQPLGLRSAADVWKRQIRWARLRRASFPFHFAPEILSGGLAPVLAIAFVAAQTGYSPVAAVIVFTMLWYGAELFLVVKAGWHVSRHSLTCAILRDLMLPALYLNAWGGSGFEWRGNEMQAVESARLS